MEGWLRERYPSSDPGWVRVRFDQIKGKKKLEDDLSRIMSYAGKPVRALFSAPTRDTKGNGHQTCGCQAIQDRVDQERRHQKNRRDKEGCESHMAVLVRSTNLIP